MKLQLVFSATLLSAAAISSPAALAHDFWIEPQDYRPAINTDVPIVLRVGEDFTGTSQPLIPAWFSNYAATGPSGVKPVRGMIGDDPAGSFIPDANGNWVVGYRSTRDFVEIEPKKFDTYLNAEGLEWVKERRAETGEAESNAREIYSRCAKALIQVGDGTGTFDQALGYTLELIPEKDPYRLEVGGQLPLQLLYNGEPISDILIIAFTAEAPKVQQQHRTDAEGRVSINLSDTGTWLVKGVHIIELPEEETRADWESFWASLTFQL
ncbi:MAG: DUF4198 domain-containing protein [Gammaproteobacteria bacterium]